MNNTHHQDMDEFNNLYDRFKTVVKHSGGTDPVKSSHLINCIGMFIHDHQSNPEYATVIKELKQTALQLHNNGSLWAIEKNAHNIKVFIESLDFPLDILLSHNNGKEWQTILTHNPAIASQLLAKVRACEAGEILTEQLNESDNVNLLEQDSKKKHRI